MKNWVGWFVCVWVFFLGSMWDVQVRFSELCEVLRDTVTDLDVGSGDAADGHSQSTQTALPHIFSSGTAQTGETEISTQTWHTHTGKVNVLSIMINNDHSNNIYWIKHRLSVENGLERSVNLERSVRWEMTKSVIYRQVS